MKVRLLLSICDSVEFHVRSEKFNICSSKDHAMKNVAITQVLNPFVVCNDEVYYVTHVGYRVTGFHDFFPSCNRVVYSKSVVDIQIFLTSLQHQLLLSV